MEAHSILLTVHVKPKAKESVVVAWVDETTLKIRVKEPAEKGKANEAVMRLLAVFFSVSVSEVELIRGFSTGIKHIRIPKKAWETKRPAADQTLQD